MICKTEMKSRESRWIVILCFIAFVVWQIALIVHYEGWYAFDELYHISSSNFAFDAVSQYQRAPQINGCVKVLTILLGKSYYTFKLIPLFLSSLTMIIVLYLTCKLTSRWYLPIVATAIMSFQRLLVCYHIMVRFYVWDEAMVAILALLLFWLSGKGKWWKKLFLHACYFFVMSFTYFIHPSEESYLAILLTGAAAWITNLAAPNILQWLRGRRWIKWMVVFLIIALFTIESIMVAMKMGMIETPRAFGRFTNLGVKAPSFFYIPGYFATQGLLLTVALLCYGAIVLKEKLQNGIIGIYTLAILPFLAYNIFFSDMYLIRGIVPYIPMMILVVVLWLDRWKNTRWINMLVPLITIIGIWLSYSDMGVLEFYQGPDIPGEYNLDNYEGLVSKACEEIKNGRKCIAVWENDHQEACFDIDTTYSFTINDSINSPHDITEEEILDLFVFLMNTDEQYLVLVGPHTGFRIDKFVPGFMYGLKAKYPYDEFTHYEYLFYIN